MDIVDKLVTYAIGLVALYPVYRQFRQDRKEASARAQRATPQVTSPDPVVLKPGSVWPRVVRRSRPIQSQVPPDQSQPTSSTLTSRAPFYPDWWDEEPTPGEIAGGVGLLAIVLPGTILGGVYVGEIILGAFSIGSLIESATNYIRELPRDSWEEFLRSAVSDLDLSWSILSGWLVVISALFVFGAWVIVWEYIENRYHGPVRLSRRGRVHCGSSDKAGPGIRYRRGELVACGHRAAVSIFLTSAHSLTHHSVSKLLNPSTSLPRWRTFPFPMRSPGTPRCVRPREPTGCHARDEVHAPHKPQFCTNPHKLISAWLQGFWRFVCFCGKTRKFCERHL